MPALPTHLIEPIWEQFAALLLSRKVGGGAHELLEQCLQEASVVYRAQGQSHRLLDRLLGGNRHRRAADPRSLDSLPLGRSTPP